MKMEYTVNKVLENVEISEGIYKLSIGGEFSANPGQFYMLRSWGTEPVLSRPISICDVSDDGISFLYEVRGRGTRLFKDLRSGDSLELLGPLGNGFDVSSIKGKVAIVAGGIGIAPMFYTAKSLEGAQIDLYGGFRDQVYLTDEFKGYVDNVYISTDSGKVGHKGFVTDMLEPSGYDVVLCCGPEVMMQKVSKMCIEHRVQCFVSMEKHMACGIGACLVCTCKTKDGNKRTCKDGPVFSGEDVIFDA